MNAWETVFAEKIQKSRENELKCLDKDSIYWTLMSECATIFEINIFFHLINNVINFLAFLTHLSSVIITFVTFAVFLSIESNDVSEKFTTGRVFAALALFNQLTVPLFIFPITIPMIISAIVSTRRLEKFLCQNEVQKQFEGIRNMARVMSRSDASLDVFEIDENDGQTIDRQTNEDPSNDSQGSATNEALLLSKRPLANKTAFSTTNNDFQFNNDFYLQDIDENSTEQQAIKSLQRSFSNRRSFNTSVKLKKNNKISESMKQDRNRPRQKSLTTEIQMEIPSELVLSIRNAIFCWRRNSTELESPLRINSLNIPRGQFNFLYFEIILNCKRLFIKFYHDEQSYEVVFISVSELYA